MFLLCDQVYQGLGPADLPRLTEDADLRGQLLLCQSFSKPYAMTGWRAGYLAGPAELIGELTLLNAAQIASVPTFVQEACITALHTDYAPMAET